MRTGLSRLVLPSLLAAALCPRELRANGRFPLANDLIFQPLGGRRAVLRTSFGLLVSDDDAATWRWVCEDAVSNVPLRDPPVSFGGDGRVVLAISAGLRASTTLCDWPAPTGAPIFPVVDLTADATGAHVLAVGGDPSGVFLSDDGGSQWRAAGTVNGLLAVTVDNAPNLATRVYLSGNLGATPVLYRSDDGAMTFREVARDFDGAGVVYIAAVDRNNADVIYLRALSGAGGTTLLRSDDGGAHTTVMLRTESPMLGFALSDDGRTVWSASNQADEGVQRSVDGGAFVRVGTPHTALCLRYHDGALWMCADEPTEGYSLARSTDGGETFTPVLRLRDVLGPATCPAGTAVAARCGPLWPAQRDLFPAIDAGTPDSGSGAVADAGRLDAGLDAGSAPRSSGSGCGCGVGGTAGLGGAWAWALLVVGHRRRRTAA